MEETTKTNVIDIETVKEACCPKQEAPVTGDPDPQDNIKKQIMENLGKLHALSFNKFLQVKYPEGVEKIAKETLDAEFEAFACGFNSGIYQAAGEILFMVGVNLNELQPAMSGGFKNPANCSTSNSTVEEAPKAE